MQLVNNEKLSNITLLSTSFAAAAIAVFEVAIVPLKSIYASLQSHKLYLIIEVLNLI